jgi:two-component system, cell cycle response regulator DivK
MAIRVVFCHVGSDDREMYAEYLRGQGFEVIETGTTDGAVSELADAHVLITGLMVPGFVTPVGLIARIRQGCSSVRKPVLVLTACSQPAVLNAARRAGADVLLIKPCYPDDLLNALHRVLDEHGFRDVGEGVYLVPVADRRRRSR